MNHFTFSKALEGYFLYAQARGLSEDTIADYTAGFTRFGNFIGPEKPFNEITADHLTAFLAAENQRVSLKTTYNYHIALGALWSWAIKYGLATVHIPQSVPRPQPKITAIEPYTEIDIRAMLGSLDRSKPYRQQTNRLHHSDRSRAIIYLLLDTGMRASELCAARLSDLDLPNRKIRVLGKGNKERTLAISPRTGQVIWKYLQFEREDPPPKSPLIATRNSTPMHRRQLLRRLQTIGDRAGISDVTVHRFRHTFAIQYLRNGGNVYALQAALGHTTLNMVRRYLSIVQADLDRTHQIASPISNWGL